MSNKLTIKDEWARFSLLVFGDKKPSDVQYQEMRRAFYAGFGSALMTCGEATDLPTDEAIETINKMHNEVAEFVIELLTDQA
jgi:hypothetical protein